MSYTLNLDETEEFKKLVSLLGEEGAKLYTDLVKRMGPAQKELAIFVKERRHDSLVLKVPESFCLYENPKEVLAFIRSISTAVYFEKKYAVLDFSDCKDITAAAALVLFAEVSRCRGDCPLSNSGKVIQLIRPKSKKVAAQLKESSLLRVIQQGSQRRLQDINDDERVFFCTGNNPKEDTQALVDRLKKKLDVDVLPPNIAKAIGEGFLNVRYHAYKKGATEFTRYRWWLYCYDSVRNGNKSVVFVLYDRGVGIPSLVEEHFDSVLTTEIAPKSHGLMIAKAFETKFSTDPENNRGVGSRDILSPIAKTDDLLLVLSDKGAVEFGGIDDFHQPDFWSGCYLKGTLLQWRLYV